MKKVISLLLVGLLSCGLFGCGAKEEKKDTAASAKKETKQEQQENHQVKLDFLKTEAVTEVGGENPEYKKLKEGVFYNSAAGTCPSSRVYTIRNTDNKDKLNRWVYLELEVKATDKFEQVKEFADKAAKFKNYSEKTAVGALYKGILVLMFKDGKYTGNALKWTIDGDEVTLLPTLVVPEYQEAFENLQNLQQ